MYNLSRCKFIYSNLCTILILFRDDPDCRLKLKFFWVCQYNEYNELEKILKVCTFNLDTKNFDGQTGLHLAAIMGHLEVAKLLLKNGASVNVINKAKNTPIVLAVENIQENMVQLLAEHNADVNAKIRPENKTTLIHWCSSHGHDAMVDILLNLKAHVDPIQNGKITPLHLAAEKGYSLVCQKLLKHNANVNALNEKQETPLHIASTNGHTLVAKILLNYKAQVDMRDGQRNQTPLHRAAKMGHLAVVEVLLKNGAEMDVKDYRNWTAKQLAKEKNHSKIVDTLQLWSRLKHKYQYISSIKFNPIISENPSIIISSNEDDNIYEEIDYANYEVVDGISTTANNNSCQNSELKRTNIENQQLKRKVVSLEKALKVEQQARANDRREMEEHLQELKININRQFTEASNIFHTPLNTHTSRQFWGPTIFTKFFPQNHSS